ncbi:hypothetical protein HYALB_00011987 [Hymenoscyphus albidus]|uniref:Uncharacterized protein n=1 Tax=Hymenoscyphus albidus TaxID=595503 RepID=A0A9N9LQU4_9HELO|nr:hypothetical protein HYALB_00011987 [Hymenoscyphus albidus]
MTAEQGCLENHESKQCLAEPFDEGLPVPLWNDLKYYQMRAFLLALFANRAPQALELKEKSEFVNKNRNRINHITKRYLGKSKLASEAAASKAEITEEDVNSVVGETVETLFLALA